MDMEPTQPRHRSGCWGRSRTPGVTESTVGIGDPMLESRRRCPMSWKPRSAWCIKQPRALLRNCLTTAPRSTLDPSRCSVGGRFPRSRRQAVRGEILDVRSLDFP